MLYFYKKQRHSKDEGQGGEEKWGWCGLNYNKIIVMKKFSLVSNEEIRKHLANTSSAKISHSFSKSRRFLEHNPEYFP